MSYSGCELWSVVARMISQGEIRDRQGSVKPRVESKETAILTSYFATIENSGVCHNLEQAPIGLAAMKLCCWMCKKDLAMSSEDF